MTARSVGRVLCGLAAALLAGAASLGLLPNPGRTVVDADAPPSVDCGTVFVETEYSNDDGCEGPVLRRMGWMLLLGLAAVPLGAVGLAVLWRAVRT